MIAKIAQSSEKNRYVQRSISGAKYTLGLGQVWWYTPVIPANRKAEAGLGKSMRP
jgi:hypothetical protein